MKQINLKREIYEFLIQGADWLKDSPEDHGLNIELGRSELEYIADKIATFLTLGHYIRKKKRFVPPRRKK